LTVRGVLREAWRLYILLFWRSLAIAFAIFAVLVVPGAVVDAQPDTGWTIFLASLLVTLFTSYGDLLLEGALAEDVRDHYEGRPMPGMRELARRMRPYLLTIAAATLIYAVSFAVGLALLVVPGLIILTRWSLIVPVIVVERLGIRQAFRRSSRLVSGKGWTVFAILAIVLVLCGVFETLFDNLLFWLPEFYASWVGHLVVSSLTAPYAAHALAVIYYRVVDFERARSS
jgi:hypothetical protein